MYTLTLGDDGGFAAEYVQPDADSIALGTSGSMIDVRRNEDGSYSYMDGGQWLVITADSRMSAANGNVYGPLLAPDGRTPVGVMHVAAMQDVALGALGGTLQLTQAEDMSWWLGDMQVMSGHVHAHANGNRYVLTLDAAGMWSAVYQQNMVTVALGTQGSVSLAQAEDMSWWLGTEGVESGSEVMSESGNTYTLQYADGAWTARFEPESMMIAGTGLVAMTREADDMYDVGADTLPASGVGDVSDGDDMYHVWMADGGGLAGALFDAAIENATRRVIGELGTKGPAEEAGIFNLSGDDGKTTANELQTHLVVDGDEYSFADLLGRGMASVTGTNFVAEALKKIQASRSVVDRLLGLDLENTALNPALDREWGKVTDELDNIFGEGKGDDYTGALAGRAAGSRNPGEDDILEELDDIIAALSSADAFTAATAEDGDGVFEDAELSAKDAAAAYARVKSSGTVTLGREGSTRYGTVNKIQTSNAVTKAKYAPRKAGSDGNFDTEDDVDRIGERGAFSYSTMEETLRTRHIVSTGNAYYTGGTHAISGDGTVYSGTMDVQVRFSSMSVSGLVSQLASVDKSLPWEYVFGDVSTIRLPDARLSSNARWAAASNAQAQATFAPRAGSPASRPISGGATFNGILLGRGAEAGSEASGTWSVGAKSDDSDYLAGAFGVMRGADVESSLPTADDGSGTEASVVAMIGTSAAAIAGAKIEDGMLKLKVLEYDYNINRSGDTALHLSTFPTWAIQTTPAENGGDPTENTVDLNINLVALLSSGERTFSSGTHVAAQVAEITKQRDVLAQLQGLDDAALQSAEVTAWQNVQNALFRVFGSVPPELAGTYAAAEEAGEALELIDDALAALANATALKAALDPEGSGIFKGVTNDKDSRVRTKGSVNHGGWRTPANILGQRQFQILSKLGSTAYTRFGVWRMRRYRNAVRTDKDATDDGGPENRTRAQDGGADGPGMFAYSQLKTTEIASTNDPSYQPGGTARYVGEAVALQDMEYLTGEVDASVTWSAANAAVGGTLNVTFSNLANANGDMLAFGTEAGKDEDGNIIRNNEGGITTPAIYNVIRDVVFNNIDVGTNGDDELLFDNGDIGTRTAGAFAIRYRFADASVPDNTSGAGSIEGRFVGASVDGPLGLLGIWQLNANGSLGRENAAGDDIVDLGQAIYGAFGAEAP